jgi:hypothetical protein
LNLRHYRQIEKSKEGQIMRLYLERKKKNISATAEYDMHSKKLVILQGSKISDTISYTKKFRGANSIEKNRVNVVDGCVVRENIEFKSASTAANFITGSSTNGLTAWKDEAGRKLKDILADEVEE